MTRLLALMRADVVVQMRNHLYTIGLSVAALTAGMFAWLGSAQQLPALVPAILLMIVGGTTLIYVGALIFFEKEQGTLNAHIVSPMRISEYLWSKIITLSALATLESAVVVGGAMLIMSVSQRVPLPNIPLFLIGVMAIAIIYALMGVILMVRYSQITDFLIPMAALVAVLQLPFLYFWGVIEHPAFLLFPTSAPAMLIRGAFVPLAAWEWVYGLGYTIALMIGLTMWAYHAFHTHIIMRVA